MTQPSIDRWVQYTHLEKLYGYLPGMAEAVPTVFGLTRPEYDTVCARFAARAAAAARRLLDDPAFARAVDALPFARGESLLAVGDSITDDLQSWAEILRHLLDQQRPDLEVRVVNAGLSAHTTTMVLRRWPATVAAARPDWVLCALGQNDLTRIGPEPTDPQVEPAVSVANLDRLRVMAPHPRWVWLSPVPVREDRIADHPPFRFGASSWRNDDVVAFARQLRTLDGDHVDLVTAFGVPADPGLQGPDGVHPALDGQVAIARALVEHLAATSRPATAAS